MKRSGTTMSSDSLPISEQAAHWWVVLNEETCTATEREAFAAWVRRSPERVEAFLRVNMLMGTLHSKERRWPETPAEELIRQARASSAEIIPLTRSEPAVARRATARVPGLFGFAGARMFIAASLAMLCCAVLLSWFVWAPERYQTEIGEQRSVLLDDGSIITLNTSSQIEVKYSDSRRFVRLVRGEALFKVARDPDRPFDVDTDNAVVRAVGTQFNVDRRAHRTTVSVVEGKVQVIADPAEGTPRPAGDGAGPAVQSETEILAAAQRLVLTDSGMGEPEAIADIAPVTAWTQRQLVFENQSLSEVAEEFNRYNRQHILIESAPLRAQLVTGVFQANDSASFLVFISRIPGVRISTTEQGHHLVSLDAGLESGAAGEGPE
jgi:transmembrane sensor